MKSKRDRLSTSWPTAEGPLAPAQASAVPGHKAWPVGTVASGLLFAVAVVGSPVAARAAAVPEATLVLRLDDQAKEIWSSIPENPNHPSIVRLGHTSEACAAAALEQARDSASRAQQARMALSTLALRYPISRSVLEGAGDSSNARLADLFGLYRKSADASDFVGRAKRTGETAASRMPGEDNSLRTLYASLSEPRSDQALQPILTGGPRPGFVLYDVRAQANKPGRLFLRLLAEGGSGCPSLGAGAQARRWRVLGEVELEPGEPSVDSRGVEISWKAKAPRFVVLASCGACEASTEKKPPVKVAASPCGQPCGALAEGGLAWQEEASHVEAEVRSLAEKASLLESELTTQQKDLGAMKDGSAKAPSPKTRDAIARLTEKAEAVRGEIGRVRNAVKEAQDRLGDVRQAVEDLQGQEQSCQAQCRARQQNQEARSKEPAKHGGAGRALAIGGGVAAAAGVGVAVAGGGSSSSPPPPTSPAAIVPTTPPVTPAPITNPCPPGRGGQRTDVFPFTLPAGSRASVVLGPVCAVDGSVVASLAYTGSYIILACVGTSSSCMPMGGAPMTRSYNIPGDFPAGQIQASVYYNFNYAQPAGNASGTVTLVYTQP